MLCHVVGLCIARVRTSAACRCIGLHARSLVMMIIWRDTHICLAAEHVCTDHQAHQAKYDTITKRNTQVGKHVCVHLLTPTAAPALVAVVVVSLDAWARVHNLDHHSLALVIAGVIAVDGGSVTVLEAPIYTSNLQCMCRCVQFLESVSSSSVTGKSFVGRAQPNKPLEVCMHQMPQHAQDVHDACRHCSSSSVASPLAGTPCTRQSSPHSTGLWVKTSYTCKGVQSVAPLSVFSNMSHVHAGCCALCRSGPLTTGWGTCLNVRPCCIVVGHISWGVVAAALAIVVIPCSTSWGCERLTGRQMSLERQCCKHQQQDGCSAGQEPQRSCRRRHRACFGPHC